MAPPATSGGSVSPDSIKESVTSDTTARTAYSSLPAAQPSIGGVNCPGNREAGNSSCSELKGLRWADGATKPGSAASEKHILNTNFNSPYTSNTSQTYLGIPSDTHSKSSITSLEDNMAVTVTNFSNDYCETRIVEVKGIDPKVLNKQIEAFKANGYEVHNVVPQEDGTGSTVIWISFDDLRVAAHVVKEWNHIFPGCLARYVTLENLGAAMNRVSTDIVRVPSHPAQFEIVAVWTGPADQSSITDLYKACNELANAYGEVRCLVKSRVEGNLRLSCRVEFHKIRDARNFQAGTGINKENVIGKNIQATVKHWAGYLVQSTLPATEDVFAPTNASTPAGDLIPASYNRTFNGGNFNNSYSHGSHMGAGSNGYSSYWSPAYHHQQGFGMHSQYGCGPVVMPSPGAMAHLGYSPRRWPRPRRESDYDVAMHQAQTVDIENIENGSDVRTTIMIRNIPNRFGFKDMHDIMVPTSHGHFDFLYVRMDFSNSCNVGYGFVNFVRPEYIVPFLKARVGKPWPGVVSDKLCEVSYATSQGVDCLIQKFRNSSVMNEYHGFRPKLFYHRDTEPMPTGKHAGDEAPFPPPDNQQKLARSLANAQTVGLYPPRGAKGLRDGRRTRTQYDRGTPGALRDEAAAAQRGYPRSRGGAITYEVGGYQATPVRNGMNGGMAPTYGPIAPPMQTITEGMQNMNFAATPRYVPDPTQAYHAATASQPYIPFNGNGFVGNGPHSTPRKHQNYRL